MWLFRTSETFLNLLIVRKVRFSQVKLGAQDDNFVQENFIPWGVRMPCCIWVKIQTPLMEYPMLTTTLVILIKFYWKDCQWCQWHMGWQYDGSVRSFPDFSTEFMQDFFHAKGRYCPKRLALKTFVRKVTAQLGRCSFIHSFIYFHSVDLYRIKSTLRI